MRYDVVGRQDFYFNGMSVVERKKKGKRKLVMKWAICLLDRRKGSFGKKEKNKKLMKRAPGKLFLGVKG